jgi:hypothetical protein
MKKLIATVICLIVLSMSALPVVAQKRTRCANRTVYNTTYEDRYDRNAGYETGAYRNEDYRYDEDGNVYDDNYVYDDNRSVWEKHRDKITTAAGAAGGAVLGGLAGGKKGAIIGAITGGAGAAVYTYKIRNRDGRY